MALVTAIGQWVDFVLQWFILFFCWLNFKRQKELLNNDQILYDELAALRGRVLELELRQ